MNALGLAVKPLGMQDLIHGPCGDAVLAARRRGEQFREFLGILAAALEAGPMAGSERRHLVEKEQFRVIAAPDVTMPAAEIQHATDPLSRHPPARGELLSVGVEFAATIAHERAARGRREQ